jgi:hypothetical protein
MRNGAPHLRSGEPLFPSNHCSTLHSLLSRAPVAHCTATHRGAIPYSIRERDTRQINSPVSSRTLWNGRRRAGKMDRYGLRRPDLSCCECRHDYLHGLNGTSYEDGAARGLPLLDSILIKLPFGAARARQRTHRRGPADSRSSRADNRARHSRRPSTSPRASIVTTMPPLKRMREFFCVLMVGFFEVCEWAVWPLSLKRTLELSGFMSDDS